MELFKKQETDLELISDIKKGKISIEKIYNKYIDKTYNFVYFKVKDKEITEDLISEAWMKILKKINTFNPEKEHQVSVWIFRVVRNHMFDYFKKNKPIISNSEEVLEYLEGEKQNFDKKIDDEIFRKIIISEMKNLSKQESEIINLKFFSDLKNKEIANILKIKENSVSSTISKGLRKLENIFENNDKYKLMFN